MSDDLKRSLLRLRIVHFQGVVAQMVKNATGLGQREAWGLAVQVVNNLMLEHGQMVDSEHLAMFKELQAKAAQDAVGGHGRPLDMPESSASWPGVRDKPEAKDA